MTTAMEPEDRRQRILAATVTVVRERGFAGARVADIAEAAGTSTGLVLYHFGSLAGALTEALTWLEDAFYRDVEKALQATADPVERLRVMAGLGAGSGSMIGEWVLWLELWVRALREEKARAARATLDQRWRGALHDVVSSGVATGVFTTADIPAVVMRLACLMDGLAIQLALDDPDLDPGRFRLLWLQAAALELAVPAEIMTSDVTISGSSRTLQPG